MIDKTNTLLDTEKALQTYFDNCKGTDGVTEKILHGTIGGNQTVDFLKSLLKKTFPIQGIEASEFDHLDTQTVRPLPGGVSEDPDDYYQDGKLVVTLTPCELDYHNDGYNFDITPFFMVLYCIDNDPVHEAIATKLMPVRSVCDQMSTETLSTIMSPLFPYAEGKKSWVKNHKASGCMISSFCVEHIDYALENNNQNPKDELEKKVSDSKIAFLEAAFQAEQQGKFYEVVLQPGEFILFSNLVYLHAREEIPQQSKRHLNRLRMYWHLIDVFKSSG